VAFQADPDSALSGREEPVLLDEWQAVPESSKVPRDASDLRGYVERAFQSGFPEAALSLSGRTRARWIESYLDQLLIGDAMHSRDPGIQPSSGATFEACALNFVGLVARPLSQALSHGGLPVAAPGREVLAHELLPLVRAGVGFDE